MGGRKLGRLSDFAFLLILGAMDDCIKFGCMGYQKNTLLCLFASVILSHSDIITMSTVLVDDFHARAEFWLRTPWPIPKIATL